MRRCQSVLRTNLPKGEETGEEQTGKWLPLHWLSAVSAVRSWYPTEYVRSAAHTTKKKLSQLINAGDMREIKGL